ncbi:MAG TPA: thioredoxin family protein [Epsilonproteobacteria bacterium]|nr:thioredoxin family protein [Campylobacterota bacterium]
MKKVVLALCMLSGTLFAVDWVKDLDTALATAQKEHKNVMVMVEGEFCRWCKKMKGRTLSDERIEKRLEQYVVVKVMREDASIMAKLPPVEGVPTIFFMKPNKAVIQEVLGYEDVTDFNATLNDVEKRLK